ncbi:hypothetical protein BOTBODRAFT_74218, partial [Botryobasidium botryosum FD-172 SS1]
VIWREFTRGALRGDFKGNEVFMGLVEAVMIKSEWQAKGKQLTNMTYSTPFNELCNLLADLAPRAYRVFKYHFAGRSLRSMRAVRSILPKFEPGISLNNVAMVAASLRCLGYGGPLALARDETKVEAALQGYQDAAKEWHLLGPCTGEVVVKSVDALDALLQDPSIKKGTKACVWTLGIPLPGIPAFVVAAKCLGEDSDAQQLVEMDASLFDLLRTQGIRPCSIAADGAEVERSVQRQLAISNEFYTYTIYHALPTLTLVLQTPIVDGIPVVMVQDSKHAYKTARNQLLAGARFLVMGDHPLHYEQLHNIAHSPIGPLFVRDVEKVDKQDDRAAARLFSPETIEFLCKLQEGPKPLGLIVYLFIIGEILDAWQNREIPHIKRIQLGLRARAFLMAWHTHVKVHPDHTTHVQFISSQSHKILLSMCDSLILLVIVYRKYYPEYPLCPWLHSTECVEHLFGILRQLRDDFTFSNIIYMVPKAVRYMSGAFGVLSIEEQANKTAAGYHHTYFKSQDLDIAALMVYPSDTEISGAFDAATTEVEGLLRAVGINAMTLWSQMDPVQVPTAPSSETPREDTD